MENKKQRIYKRLFKESLFESRLPSMEPGDTIKYTTAGDRSALGDVISVNPEDNTLTLKQYQTNKIVLVDINTLHEVVDISVNGHLPESKIYEGRGFGPGGRGLGPGDGSGIGPGDGTGECEQIFVEENDFRLEVLVSAQDSFKVEKILTKDGYEFETQGVYRNYNNDRIATYIVTNTLGNKHGQQVQWDLEDKLAQFDVEINLL